jgi:hypothetical protein
MENTRTEVLGKIMNWAQDKDGHPVCLLSGPAGSGKSTIAHTIALEYDRDELGKKLAFSYFFSRRNRDRNNMDKFFPTFAYQLAHFLPSVQQSMQAALKDRSILAKRRQEQLTDLIIQPVQSSTMPASPMIIVIDGLDEYDEVGGKLPLDKLIHLLVNHLPKLSFRLLFTSRPEARIEAIFSGISSATRRIALQDYPDSPGVFNYLHSELSEVRRKRDLPQGWPFREDLQRLAEKSESIWIYASTLVKFIDDEYDYPPRKLELALAAHNGLYALFEQVLGDAKKYPHFDLVLGAVVFVRDSPRILVVSRLLQLNSVHDVRLALRGCLSILRVPDGDDDYIRPYHASLLDFLSNRMGDRFIDPVKCHGAIAEGCIQLITAEWESNSEALRYACQNWCHHMRVMLSRANDVSEITSNLGSGVANFLDDLFRWFKIWMVGCKDCSGVEQVRYDLHAACGMVGQLEVLLICPR